jgi:hypothetical protein
MSSNYSGKTGSIVLPTSLNITSSSNTNPITITTSTPLPAAFFTGAAPLVHISGHLTNTQANNIWIATPTGPSTFTIPVAGTGVGVATGTVQPIYLDNIYTLPSDGDADNAASVSAWGQATGDRTQWLASRVGQFKLARREIFQHTNIGVTPWAHWPAGGLTIGVIQQWVGDAAAWGTAFGSSVASPSAGPGNVVFAIDGVVAGDYVSVKLVSCFITPALHALALYGTIKPSGFAPSWPTDFGQVTAASVVVDAAGTGNATANTFVCEGVVTNSASQSGAVWIEPVIYPLTNDSPSLQLVGDALLTIDIWRPTGMPQ